MDVATLGASLTGALHLPGDEGWQEGRTLFNAMVERRPAAIARVADVADVIACVDWARASGTQLTVRSAGHSVAGMSLNDGGLVIDVRDLAEVEVDPAARVARAGGGAAWAAFDAATQAHGLATTGGRVSTTGVVGLTIGGGSGWLERSCGLACDNLVAVELVTAAGEHVRATETERPELLWVHRGGGGNFGVVTALEFRLHEVGPTVFGGLAAYDPADAPTLLRAFRDFYLDAPEASGLIAAYLTAPAEDFIPAEWQGRLVFAFAGMWNGTVAEGERALRPVLSATAPIADLFGPIPYAELQHMIDDPPGHRNWWTAEYLEALPDEAVDAFVAYAEQMPLGLSQALLAPWGGAVARGLESALSKRDAAFVVHPFCVWDSPEEDERTIAWGRAGRDVFAAWATGGLYLNFVGDEGEERIRAAFGEHYERLAAVKTEVDPDNVFRGNQNIRPTGELVV